MWGAGIGGEVVGCRPVVDLTRTTIYESQFYGKSEY